MAKSTETPIFDATVVETEPKTPLMERRIVKQIAVTSAVIVTATVGVALAARAIKNRATEETQS